MFDNKYELVVMTSILIFVLIFFALITSCHLKETKSFLDAGCSQQLENGRIVWINCKKESDPAVAPTGE